MCGPAGLLLLHSWTSAVCFEGKSVYRGESSWERRRITQLNLVFFSYSSHHFGISNWRAVRSLKRASELLTSLKSLGSGTAVGFADVVRSEVITIITVVGFVPDDTCLSLHAGKQ